MGDGAKAMSKAGREVFCDLERCFRLMCWAHVHRNICPQLKCISAHRKDLAKNILVDIENLQWSVLNEATFRHVFTLLEKKYLDKYNPIINDSVSKFFKYMRTVWVESEEFRWYEGAHPWQVSNNQGVEGKNKEIKQSHTFRERLELGALFGVMLRLVKEWAEEEDILLTSSRLAILHNDINSLKMRTQRDISGLDRINLDLIKSSKSIQKENIRCLRSFLLVKLTISGLWLATMTSLGEL